MTRHAGEVDAMAERLSEVTAAAAHLGRQDGAYGEWPSKLILPFLDDAQENAVHEMRTGTDATSHLADLLRALTIDISLTDAEAAHLLGYRETER
ncbi:hypothetical protein [Actinoplanes philippinensis]|uniref:hypothetical protein n=1 Tax=Actinoplanes philippinensis TaxID=35752 RepID=UPI0011604488|nr:hypothetical protein [Actinoplanes philippinensis]